MNTSGDRLRLLLREVHLSASDFAKNRDVTPQHVNNWFKRGVPAARLNEIAETLSVNSKWLHKGEGPKHPIPYPTNKTESPVATTREDSGRYITGLEKVDIDISIHPACTPGSPILHSVRMPLKVLESMNVPPERAICAYMLGNSMVEVIQDGSTLAIDRGRTTIIDGEIYALEHAGMLRVKYLYRQPGGGLRLRSPNSAEYPDEIFSYEQTHEQNIKVLGWVFWWSTLNNRRPPVPVD